MSRLYHIQATVTFDREGYTSTISFPTFYLDSKVQGITNSGHAAKIAETIVNPHGEGTCHIVVGEVPNA